MSDLEWAGEYEADRLWASVVKETGIWMAPYSDQVADFGRLLIPKMRDALAAARREGAEEMRERALEAARDGVRVAFGERRDEEFIDENDVIGSIEDAFASTLTPEKPA